MDKCLFCSIAAGQVPAEIVHHDSHTTAFLDIHPHAPGHTMVVPNVHATVLAELPTKEVGPLFAAVQVVTTRLARALHPDGFTIGINQGVGQGVPHLHVHIMPRFTNDGGGSLHSVVKNPPSESIEEIAKRIKQTKNN